MKKFIGFIKTIVIALWLIISSQNGYSQEIPHLDTLTLGNGLKIYLIQYGKDSLLTVKFVINGGKKNETECQVGYSNIIQGLIQVTLNEKHKFILKNEKISCDINYGQTVINTLCSKRTFNTEMEILSTTIARLSFTKDKVDPVVSAIGYQYIPENINSHQLAHVFKHLILYGSKNPLGRTYCQYQIQKVPPDELREFYNENYTPKRSALVIFGNFNPKEIKKLIANQFIKWRSLRKEENLSEEYDLEIPEIKNKEIDFINKTDSKEYFLKWLQSAPSSRSYEHPAFLIACDLFDRFLAERIKGVVNDDTVKFKPISYISGFTEMDCLTGQNNLTKIIKLFDSILQSFHKLKFTENDLEATIKNLKSNYVRNNNPETILSIYDPLIYDFESQKNYLDNLSGVTLQEVQMILKKYFNPDSYKLIIVGKEHLVSDQLNLLGNITKYQTSDFETCDEACKEIIIIKCHCESCYRRGYCNIWRFDPNDKKAIKSAKARAKYTVK